MTKIHFASLFSVDFDMDLISHWICHYIKFDFDSYHITLNTQRRNFEAMDFAEKAFRSAGFTVSRNTGIFNAGELRKNVMNLYRSSLYENDILITADSDEFQELPSDFKYLAGKYDVTAGMLVDRYDDTLHNAETTIPIESQYPYSGDMEKIIMKEYKLDNSSWVKMNKNKIISSRVKIPVAFGGSHCVYPDYLKIYTVAPEIYNVFHYTWRNSIIERMCGKPYFSAANVWYVKEFFGLDEVPKVLDNKIREYEEAQALKGWN